MQNLLNWATTHQNELMTSMAILCFVIILGQRFLPIVHIINTTPREFGRNAKNGVVEIWICRKIPLQSWIGVFSQELFEFGYRWRRAMLPVFFDSWKRKAEMRGHLVECLVAEEFDGFDFHEYLDIEIRTMLNGYDGLFNDYNEETLRAAMLKNKPECMDWIHKHRDVLNEWHDKWKSNDL